MLYMRLVLMVPFFFCVLPSSAQRTRPVDRAAFDKLYDEVSNWGRWGADDQKGTLNLITPEKRVAAARLVQTGVSVSMALELITEAAADVDNPIQQTMVNGQESGDWAVDRYNILYHGYAHSHMDALCHRFYKEHLYNGGTRDDVSDAGCARMDISQVHDGLFTRAVLMDIARLKGVEYLEPGTAIYAEDLEAWEKEAGVTVSEGDALLLRTGRWARRQEIGPWNAGEAAAGLHASAMLWLKERGVSILGSDLGSEVAPSGVEGITHPVHVLALVAMGLPILDNLDLEAVSEEAARQNRWHFLVTGAPMPVKGGTGSPLNLVATF